MAKVIERQEGGSAEGHFGPCSGIIGGEFNDGKPYGYGGGACEGFGYTQTIPPQNAQAQATPEVVERQAGGSAGGHLGPGEGVIGGDLNNGKPYGYAGGAFNGQGTTVTLAARVPEPTQMMVERQAGGAAGGHLGPGEGTIGGDLNNGKPYGFAGGAFGGVGYTQTIAAREPEPTQMMIERQAGGSAGGHLGPGEGTIGGDLNNGKPYGYAGGAFDGMGTTITLAARQPQATGPEIGGGLAGTEGPFQGTAGGAINGPTGFVQGCLGGAFDGMGTTACFPVSTAPAETKVSLKNHLALDMSLTGIGHC